MPVGTRGFRPLVGARENEPGAEEGLLARTLRVVVTELHVDDVPVTVNSWLEVGVKLDVLLGQLVALVVAPELMFVAKRCVDLNVGRLSAPHRTKGIAAGPQDYGDRGQP